VGQKAPNAWGLFDMSGNLAEWCFDQCGPYGSGTMAEPDKDPFGQEGLWLPGDRTGDCFPELKVTRGGSAVVSSQATWCRSAARLKEGDSSNVVGFRLVRTL
jgi:formylglycine-generating enzyme required for sulfatase activity